jgi:hypothetical protein
MTSLNTTNMEMLSHCNQVAFALFCAKQVLHLVKPEHKEVVDRCIATVELWFEGKATKEDCMGAASAARAAAYSANAASYAIADAAHDAAYAAAHAAHAAAHAAYAADAAHAAAHAAYAADAAHAAAHAAYASRAAASAAYAAYAAAGAVAYAAYAAAYAATSDKETTIKAQWNFYDELLKLDYQLVGE